MVTNASDLPEGTVTVLFTDVVGSTELTNRVGDDIARTIMRGCEEIVRAQLVAHRGTEVKGTGDGQMVAFQSARRAVACAVDIQRAVARRNRQAPGQAVHMRIGMHTGEVVQEDADLFGATVNAAARIADAAQPGEILLPEEVRGVLGRASPVDLIPRGEIMLKGFDQPWMLHAVVWEDESSERGGDADRAPMVGRDADYATLSAAIEAAVDGRGSLILVGGEPGVGKTRLTEEGIAEARRRGMLTLVGHCYDQEQTTPYAPFVDILQQAVRVVPPDAFRRALGEDAPEIARLMPQLRAVFGDIDAPPTHPSEDARRFLHDAILGFIERASAVQPLLLVWEDLHWADEASLALLQHLARPASQLRLLSVGTYRDTELSTGRPLAHLIQDLGRERLVSRITLRRLSEDDVAAMLRGLSAQEPPAGLVRVLFGETDGVPFFLEEVFQHLVEEGKLYDEAGQFQPNLTIEENDVPEGARLAIERRLARVSDATRKLLARIAVGSRRFDFELALLITEADDDALLDALEEAVAAHLVEELGQSHESRYEFSHELVRQTLIATLSSRRRQLAHAQAAVAIETHLGAAAQEHAAELAYHWYEAGAAGDSQKALALTQQAQRAAESVSALAEAAVLWARALELLDELEIVDERLAQHLVHAEVLNQSFVLSGEQVHRSARRLAALYAELGEAEASARAHLNLGASYAYGANFDLLDPELARSHLETALDLLAGGDSPTLVQVYDFLAVTAAETGRWREGLEAANAAVEAARRLETPELEAWSASWQGKYQAWNGQFEAGLRRFDEAYELSLIGNATVIAMFVPWRVGLLLSGHLLDPKAAEPWITRELDLDRLPDEQRFWLECELPRAQWQAGRRPPLPDFSWRPAGGPDGWRPALAWLAYRAGEWAVAEEIVAAGRSVHERSGIAWTLAEISEVGAAVATARGDTDRALELLRSTLDYYAGGGRVGEVAARSELAVLLARRGETDPAREELKICDELTGDVDWRGRAGQFAVARGLIADHQGETELADRELTHAIAIFREYSVPWFEAEALLLWGEALADRSDETGADDRFSAAEEILRRVEAGQPWLERLAATRSQSTG